MKLLVVLCAAFGSSMFDRFAAADFWKKLQVRKIRSAYPALTCPAQAEFRTASPVAVHGLGTSGFYDRSLRKAFFWEQASSLYEGARIWEEFRANGGKVAQICLQQSPGLDCDCYLSPAPVHKHHGGMIQDFYSEPPELYHDICRAVGKKFNLMDYWGPFTSVNGSRWIASATGEVMKRWKDDPADSLVMTYLPQMDYAPQRNGPESPQTARDFKQFETILNGLLETASANGFETVILGDYEMTSVDTPLYPNRILARKGYLKTRMVGGMSYLNLHSSTAFALVDRQIAHLYVMKPELVPELKTLFENLPGVARVMVRDSEADWNHPRCGELILESEANAWFAYKWWEHDSEAPDFASHVDIHNKPGFDPLEVYFKLFPPMSVPLDCTLLKGAHGRACRVVCASTFPLAPEVDSYRKVAEAVRARLLECVNR